MTWDRGERNVRWGGLCGLIEVFVPTGALRAILQIVTVMMGFGLMALWVLQSRHSTTGTSSVCPCGLGCRKPTGLSRRGGRRIVSASVDG